LRVVRAANAGSLSELRRSPPLPFGRSLAVVTAFVLMKVERPRLRSIADDLLAIDGIAEVYSVAGPYDLIAVARIKEHEQLNDLVTEQIAALDGILSTETLIAFRSFSKKDLGLLWDIGS
jgi:DNA-binding Lrp family transcriptional regulator